MPEAAPKPLAIKPVPFVEAIAHSAKRGVVLPDVYYGKLQGIERSLAFSVAGMAKLDQLQQVIDSLTRALAEGATFERWKGEFLKAPDALALPKHRLDNIFRTNIQGAYARGRCVHIEKNKTKRPYLRYSAINDARVRPHHLAMHGHVAKVDDPIWKTWMPPCGYRCRCTVISMTEQQAKVFAERDANRLKNDPDAAIARATAIAQGPDKGWDYSPCENPEASTIAAAKKKRSGYAALLQSKLDEAMRTAAKLRAMDDPDQWEKVGGQRGSNKGGLYKAPDGTLYYIKEYADVAQAKGEVAAHAINELLGLTTPQARIMTKGGKPVLVSKWIGDAKTADIAELTKTADSRRQLARIYAAAALTKNWDVVGLSMDNILITSKGRLVVIDAGGSFKHRAQGAAKVFAAGPVEEMTSLLDPAINKSAAAVFGKLSEKERIAAIRALDGIKKSDLEKIFVSAGYSPSEVKELTEATWARKKWMVEAARNAEKTAKPAGATGVRVFDQAPITPEEAHAALLAAFNNDVVGYSLEQVKWKLGSKIDEKTINYFAGIHIYTGSHYKRINGALRSDNPGVMTTVARVIADGIRTMPKYTGTVKRGLDFYGKGLVRERAAFIKAHEDALKEGVPVEYRGMVSTSSKSGFSGDVKLYITAKGLQGADVMHLSAHEAEYEILFPHGSRFRVDKIKKRGRTAEIWITETEEAAASTKTIKAAIPDHNTG